MSRSLSSRALRRAKQIDRNRLIRPRTVSVQDDKLSERKRIESLWEQSINFFAGNTTKGDTDGKT